MNVIQSHTGEIKTTQYGGNHSRSLDIHNIHEQLLTKQIVGVLFLQLVGVVD